jgi:hypothetical protein
MIERPLGLRPPQPVGRHQDLAEAVAFPAKTGDSRAQARGRSSMASTRLG